MRNLAKVAAWHVNHQGGAAARELPPVAFFVVRSPMASDQYHRGWPLAMRKRNACPGCRTQGRRHSWDDFVRNAGPAQPLNLLPGTSENQGVAALESNHLQPPRGKAHHQKVDFLLRNFFGPAALAHVEKLHRGIGQSQDCRRHQFVVQHRVRGAQQPRRLQSKQFGIIRTRPHQINLARHHCSSSPSPPLRPLAKLNSSWLVSERSSSRLRSAGSSLLSTSRLSFPSCSTHPAYSWPNCCSSLFLIR